MISALFSVALLLSGTPVQAPAGTSTAPAGQTTAAKEEKKICKRDLTSGTRLGTKRTCLTAAEWKARDTTFKSLGDVSK